MNDPTIETGHTSDHAARTAMLVVRGGVERGDARGRTIGFPTANVAIANDELLDGVWAGWVDHPGGRNLAAISIGSRPTFYGRAGFRLLEAHLLDFGGDLYDDVIDVWVCHHLRTQRRFAGVGELVAQLGADVAATRSWAATAPPALPRVEDRLVGAPFGVPLPIARSA